MKHILLPRPIYAEGRAEMIREAGTNDVDTLLTVEYRYQLSRCMFAMLT